MTYQDIFEAVFNRNLTAVKHYIEVDGVDLYSRDKRNDTLAHIAAKNVDLNMLKYLFKKDPDLFKTRGYEELTLTQLAVVLHSMTLVKYLIDDCKIDIYKEGDETLPGTCVHFAARVCNLQIFKFFIEEMKVDINLKDEWGQPLAFAAARGACLYIIEYIIQSGEGNLTATDIMNRNILCQSAVSCDLTVPKYLLDEKKLDLDLNNTLIIEDAIVYKKRFPSNNLDDFLKYFVEEKGMNVNNCIYETPLHQAAKEGMLDVVEYLIQHGADVKRKNKLDQTALQVAKDEAVIEYLREQEYLNEKNANRTRRSISAALQFGRIIAAGPERQGVSELSSTVDHPSGVIQVDKHKVNTGSSAHQNVLLLALACINSKFRQVFSPAPQDHFEKRIDPIAIDVIDNLQL